MPNERSRLIFDAGAHGVGAEPSRGRGKRARGRLYGPFTGGAAVGSGGGVGAEGSAWTVDGAGRRSRRCGAASAALCAAPLAALGVLLGVRAYAGAAAAAQGGVHGLVTARHRASGNATTSREEPRESPRRRWRIFKTKDATKRDDARAEDSTRLSTTRPKSGKQTSSSFGEFHGVESTAHPASKFDAGRTTGVALSGWLQLEEWFFAQGASHAVNAGRRDENGVCFPPMFPDAKSLGFAWASEGDLVNKLVKKYGAKVATSSFAAHRAQYITDEDLLDIASRGIEVVRLPVSWSVFARDPSKVPRGGERVLVDPVYPDRLFVNMAGADLDAVVERIRNAGLKVLIDLHNMPGGASVGTYNGVFPHPPMMFSREDLARTGLGVVRTMLRWFKALPVESRAAVHGITLLNEPGHKLPNKRTEVLHWLGNAVQTYKDEIVDGGVPDGERVPFLYVNLIETLDLNVADMSAWMRSQFTVKELETWAVLDVHHYFAWSYTGCMGGSNTGCAFSCADKPSVIARQIGNRAGEWAGTLRAAARMYGVQNLAVSEWSLATFSDSSRSCSNREVLDIMFEHQEQAYRGAGIQGYFWGWKMPHGGSHVKAWSLRDYLDGAPKGDREHALVPHGYTLEDTLELPEGSTQDDKDRLIRAYSQFPDATKHDGDDDDEGTVKIQTKDVLKFLSEVTKGNQASTAAVGDSEYRSSNRRRKKTPEQDDDDRSAAKAAEDYLKASSQLKSLIDTDAYVDDDDDDREIVIVRRAKTGEIVKMGPAGDPIRADLTPSASSMPPQTPVVNATTPPASNSTPPASNSTVTPKGKKRESKDDGSLDSLIDPTKAVPPPPPPPSPNPPPSPPTKEALKADAAAANTLEALDVTENDFSVPNGF